MKPKCARRLLVFLITAVLLAGGPVLARSQAQAAALDTITGALFTQPVDPTGKLYISSRLDPDGSGNDKYVWDNFTLPADGTITEIGWVGGYDPLRQGGGGPVIDFRISIYPSIAANTEPAIAYPPLMQYFTGSIASQTPLGMVGAIPIYSYTYPLPAAFNAAAGVKYWVQIQAYQQGTIPDWGLAAATSGNSSHYVRESGAGGDIFYHSVPGDVAFTLIGNIPGAPTDIFLSNLIVDENQLVNTIVGELSATDPNPLATFTFSLTCAAPGPDDSSFNILGTQLRTSARFNYEVQKAYTVCVRVTNQGGMSLDSTFGIAVNNLIEPVIFLPIITRFP